MRNRPQTVWALVKEVMRNDAVTRAYTKLHEAMEAEAEAAGDFHVASAMYLYYKGITEQINPEEDWWRYAEAKQKLHDYQEQMEVCNEIIEDRQQVVKTRKEVYERLRTQGEENES